MHCISKEGAEDSRGIKRPKHNKVLHQPADPERIASSRARFPRKRCRCFRVIYHKQKSNNGLFMGKFPVNITPIKTALMQRRKFIKTSAIGSAVLASSGLFSFQSAPETLPANLPSIKNPLNLYGSLEKVMEGIRANNPMDLTVANWRKKNPRGSFKQWQTEARKCVMDALHYHPGPLNLAPNVISKEDRGTHTFERIEFNTTPWHRLEAYLLLPKNVKYPVPGIVALHEWGGPMCFGKDRIANSGRDHEVLAEHRETYYNGIYLTEELVKQGYAVIVIDAHHFGGRIPKGIDDIPENLDPYTLTVEEYQQLQSKLASLLYYGVRQLNWAGTTWAGLNYFDDSRCIDYLATRPEVDIKRIGVTGLSGGGWRTNMLAALDPRIKASVSVGWMTTSDMQQHYNIRGAIGSFNLLPGVWNRMDIPDLAAMSAPNACMIVVGKEDILFPEEGKQQAKAAIKEAFDWAGAGNRTSFYSPAAPHNYNKDIQGKAFAWLEKNLKG